MRTPFNSEDFWEVVDKGYEEKKISIKLLMMYARKMLRRVFYPISSFKNYIFLNLNSNKVQRSLGCFAKIC